MRGPYARVGVLHDQAGQAQVAGDVLHFRGEGAMLPGVAVAARRAAALAAMHPAPRAAPHRRGAARRAIAGAGPCPAARRLGEDFRLHGVARRIFHSRVGSVRSATDRQICAPLAETGRKHKNKTRTNCWVDVRFRPRLCKNSEPTARRDRLIHSLPRVDSFEALHRPTRFRCCSFRMRRDVFTQPRPLSDIRSSAIMAGCGRVCHSLRLWPQ